MLALLYLVIRHSGAGLTLRAVAADPRAARLSGIRVGRVHALGWGLAAAAGAVSGVLVAPVVFLEPGMMGGVLVSALAAAAIGGFANPVAAVTGGLLIGVAETLAGTYLWADLRVVVPLVIMLAVPAFRVARLLPGPRMSDIRGRPPRPPGTAVRPWGSSRGTGGGPGPTPAPRSASPPPGPHWCRSWCRPTRSTR